MFRVLAIVATVCLAVGCLPTETPAPICTPSEATYNSAAAPVIDAKCAQCHGVTPQFGAPYSLLGYQNLLGDALTPGVRKVDAMVSKLAAGTMPPAASPQLTHIELDTLLSWASCGEVHAPPPTGLQANRAVWEAGPTPPANTTAIDVTAANEFIDVTVRDDYRNFNFTNLVASTKYIQRIEPVIDESRVLHHMTFTYGGGFPYVYAWAPGTGAIEFPNGGIALAPGDSFRLQIHYNNTAGIVDAYDSSGVRLWVGDQVGTAYGMMSPVSWNISVPPQSEGFATQECTVTMDFDILAGFPHMHETGDSFTHEVVRADGSVENLIDLTGWSFDSQYFYAMPVHINSGDVLRMTCRYYNPGDTTVKAGLATSDEMCFDFMVVTPAEAAGQCAR